MGPALIPILLGVTAVTTIAGGLSQAAGERKQAQAQTAAANYNAQVALQNSATATQNAQIAGESGAVQAGNQELRTAAGVSSDKANQAASGVDVNSGSAVGVRSSASELGMLDALTIRSNAAKEAYGYQTQASNFKGQASLDTAQGQYAKQAGDIAQTTTLLNTVGSAASNFAKFQMVGGFGGDTTGTPSGLSLSPNSAGEEGAFA